MISMPLWSNMRIKLELQVYGEPIYQQLCKKNLRQRVNIHGTTRITIHELLWALAVS